MIDAVKMARVIRLVNERKRVRAEHERGALMFDPWFDVEANRAFVEMVEALSVFAHPDGKFAVIVAAPATRAGVVHGGGTSAEILDVDFGDDFPNAHIFTLDNGLGAGVVLECPCDMHNVTE